MYHLNDEQQTILDRAVAVADGDIGPCAAEVDERGRFPREAIDALAREGFLGLNVSVEYGGLAQGLGVQCRAGSDCPALRVDCAGLPDAPLWSRLLLVGDRCLG
jgi:alkylation response protein AidB-like acyl-CoA dehydrogenase